jgi:hypothetical protein
MIKLKREQRSLLAAKVADVANVAAGALIFGQALSGTAFSVKLAIVGIGAWLAMTAAAVIVVGGGEPQ